MVDLSVRSAERELLDRQEVPADELSRNLRELKLLNAWLGGHRATLHGFRRLLEGASRPLAAPLVVCELGCGGGDHLSLLHRWCARHDLPVRLVGIDLKEECLREARRECAAADFLPICSDYRTVNFERVRPDVVFGSLFAHHLPDEELVEALGTLRASARLGFFLNDLHRHPAAYYCARSLTRWFSKSELVKNDGPLSVLRGFRRSDWSRLLRRAGIAAYRLERKWAFRWLLTVPNAP